YTLRDSTWPTVGALGAGAFLILPSAPFRALVLTGHQPYLVSLALGLQGLILIERGLGAPPSWGRFAGALVLMRLAHWVNPALCLVLGPLALFRWLLFGGVGALLAPVNAGRTPRERLCGALRRVAHAEPSRTLVLLGAGVAFAWFLMRAARYHDTK